MGPATGERPQSLRCGLRAADVLGGVHSWEADGRPIYGGFFWLNRDKTFPVPADAYYMAGAGQHVQDAHRADSVPGKVAEGDADAEI